jgi:hypothetical protein
VVVVAALATAAAPALAQPDGDAAAVAEEVTAPPAPARRALATAAAVVPGFLIHGTGHRVAGEGETAWRLLRLEGVALSAMLVGGVPLAATGASRRLAVPAIPLLVSGGGLFLSTWLADLYGASGVPGGAPRLALPPLELELGTAYVHDPRLEVGPFVVAAANLRAGPWRASPSAWIGAAADNQRLRLDAAHRLRGPTTSPARAGDGSAVEIRAAVTHHRWGAEAFASTVLEAAIAGRYDLARLSPTLAGSFAEGALGLGLEIFDYEVGGADVNDLLLARFEYGVYLGDGRGEVALFYDHRREVFAGGLALPRGGNGFVGHFGAAGWLAVSGRWGLAAELAAGSAYVGKLAVRYHLEGEP